MIQQEEKNIYVDKAEINLKASEVLSEPMKEFLEIEEEQ